MSLLPIRLAICLYVMSGTTLAWSLEPARQTQLLNLLRQDCGSCHGMTLKGGLGKPLLPKNLEHFELEGIADIILNGVPDQPMPPWKDLLSRNDALWIAAQLKKGVPPQ